MKHLMVNSKRFCQLYKAPMSDCNSDQLATRYVDAFQHLDLLPEAISNHRVHHKQLLLMGSYSTMVGLLSFAFSPALALLSFLQSTTNTRLAEDRACRPWAFGSTGTVDTVTAGVYLISYGVMTIHHRPYVKRHWPRHSQLHIQQDCEQ